jgi:hypothetical protein
MLESDCDRVDTPLVLVLTLIERVFCQNGRQLQPVAEWEDVIKVIMEKDCRVPSKQYDPTFYLGLD